MAISLSYDLNSASNNKNAPHIANTAATSNHCVLAKYRSTQNAPTVAAPTANADNVINILAAMGLSLSLKNTSPHLPPTNHRLL